MNFPLLIWNLALLGGCSYVVFGLGRSGWWFLLAILLMQKFKRVNKEDEW